MNKTERAFITFKFEDETIKYPLDVMGGGDLLRTIVQGKEEGWSLSHRGIDYDLANIKGLEISFEQIGGTE